MARGEIIRPLHDGFLPQQVPVASYGRGGFRFADMSHIGSLLALPSGMKMWDVAEPAAISIPSLEPVFAEQAAIDVLLIGTGAQMTTLADSLRWRLRDAKISVDVMATGHAAATYNLLLEEGRHVAAALIAVA